MIKIEITSENAKELHAELKQLLFGAGGQKEAGTAPKADPVSQEEPAEEEKAPAKEPVKRTTRAKKKVEEVKEETAAQETEVETSQEDTAKEEVKEEEAKAETAKEDEGVTVEQLRTVLNEKTKDPAVKTKVSQAFAKYGLPTILKLSAEQRAEFLETLNNI